MVDFFKRLRDRFVNLNQLMFVFIKRYKPPRVFVIRPYKSPKNKQTITSEVYKDD